MLISVVRVFVLALLLLSLAAVTLCASDSELTRLTGQLHSSDTTLRQQAARQLGLLDDPHAVDPLLSILKDKNAAVRLQAVESLGKYPEARVTTALLPLLKDPDNEVTQAVLFVLHDDPEPRVTTALLGAFAASKSNDVKSAIIFSFKGRSDPRVTTLLFKLLADKELGRNAARALDPTNGPQVIEALLTYLQRPDVNGYDRSDLMRRLGETNDPRVIDLAIKGLIDREYTVRYSAGEIIANAGERALPGLITAVDGVNASLAAAAIDHIAGIDTPQAREIIEQHIADQRPQVREGVLNVLAGRHDPRAVAVFLERVDPEALVIRGTGRPDPETIEKMQKSQDALYRLQVMGDVAREAVTTQLLDPDPAKRLVAVYALRQFGAKGVSALLPALDDKVLRVRAAAAGALAGRREPQLADIFLNLSHDAAPDIRAIALYHLAQTGHPRAAELLLEAAGAPEPQVRVAAVGGLMRLGDARAFNNIASALKDVPPENYGPIYTNLRRIKDPRVFDIIELALKSPDPFTRMSAMSALRGWHTARAVDLLCQAMTDAEEFVREQALVQLTGRRNDPEASTAFFKLLQSGDPDIRQQGVYLLGQTRNPAAREPLAAALTDDDPLVRQTAAEALAFAFQDPRSIPVLIEGITAEGIDARNSGEALSALGAVAVPAVLPFLKSPDPVYRGFALEWFEENPDERAVNQILPLLKDNDETVREAANRALLAIRIMKIKAVEKQPAAVNQLITYLKDTKAGLEVRQAALSALAEQHYSKLGELLASIFAMPQVDPDATELFTAINLVDDAHLTEMVENAILNPNPAVSNKAVKALFIIGNRKAIRPLLTGTVGSRRYGIETAVPDRLLQIYGQQAVEEALICLNGDDAHARNATAPLLSLSPDPRIPLAMIAVLQQGKAGRSEQLEYRSPIYSALLDWLARFGPTEEVKRAAEVLAPGLQRGDPEAIYLFLALRDPRAITPALKLLDVQKYPSRGELIFDLAAAGMDPDGRVSLRLLTLAKVGDPSLRPAAVLALARLRHPQAVELLATLLQEQEKTKEGDQIYREGDAQQWRLALLQLGDDRDLEPLLRAVDMSGGGHNEDYAEDNGPLANLEKIDDPRLNDRLLDYLWHEDYQLRKGAALVLGARRDPRAVPVLLEMLDEKMASPLSDDAIDIVRALGYSKDQRVITALLDALDDPELRDAAAIALAKVGGPVALDALIALVDASTGEASKEMIRALLQFDDPRIDALLVSFLRQSDDRDENSSTFPGIIAHRIAVAKRAKDISPLIEMLRTVESPETRAAITEALRTITGQSLPMQYAFWQAWQDRAAAAK